MKRLPALLIFFCCTLSSFGQQKEDKLFNDQRPLDIALSVSIDQVRASKADSTDVPGTLYYKDGKDSYDSIKVDWRSRGNFRLNECYFPPMSIKIAKDKSTGTLFEGNKKLKLVLPCRNQSDGNTLIVKEFICYKLFEVITPYCFKTRMVNINFTGIQKKTDKNFQLKGILIEDDDKTAKRFNAKIAEDVRASANALQDTADLRLSFFEFMISNTDWSSVFQHNIKLLKPTAGPFIPLTHDFDMSGLVDAPYAVPSDLGDGRPMANSVRDRVYRGWCRSDDVTQFVRNEFIAKEAAIMAVADQYKNELPEKEIKEIKDYLASFFAIIKDDNQYRKKMMADCRK